MVIRITHRGRGKMLWVLNVSLALAALAAGGMALAPLPEAPPAPPAGAATTVPATAPATRARPLDAYAAIYRRNLREVLFDAPTTRPVKRGPPPTLGLRLIGTAVESDGTSFAIFYKAGNEVRLASVGDSINGAQLVAVKEGSVTLKLGGRLVELAVTDTGGRK